MLSSTIVRTAMGIHRGFWMLEKWGNDDDDDDKDDNDDEKA